MTRLVTFDPNDRSRVLLDTEDADRIAAEIASCGARLERWTATAPISAEASAAGATTLKSIVEESARAAAAVETSAAG